MNIGGLRCSCFVFGQVICGIDCITKIFCAKKRANVLPIEKMCLILHRILSKVINNIN